MIISVFNNHNLELFEANKVISSLRSVMKNKKVISAKIKYNNKHKKK
jgi:hypothetical protein